MEVEILSDVVVSKNLAEKDASLSCAFPQTTVLSDGQVACIYRQGSDDKHSHDGVLVLQTSSDGGVSWSDSQIVFDGGHLQPSKTVVSGGLCQTNTGALLATFFVVDGLQPGANMFSEEGMALRRRVYATRSEDGGSTWSDPLEIDTSAFPIAAITTKPYILPGGEICVPIEVQTRFGPFGTSGTFSSDDGCTFGVPITFAEDPDGQVNLCDARFTVLKDGRVLMLLWVFLQDTEETIEVQRSYSSDMSRTWTEPEPVGMLGQIVMPLELPSGDVIAASTYRQPPEGIRLWISHDGAETWDTEHPIQMWDPRQNTTIGEPIVKGSETARNRGIWQALAGFTFGTPDLVALGDGSILLTYYATIDGINCVRACRFSVM